MELTHTHWTHQARTDMELAALTLMGSWEKKSVDDMEDAYRGKPQFEAFLRSTAAWLEDFSVGHTFKPHECRGQGC